MTKVIFKLGNLPFDNNNSAIFIVYIQNLYLMITVSSLNLREMVDSKV